MTTSEPLLPHPEGARGEEDSVAAADPGVGAPEPAPGFGIGGEEPDAAEADTADGSVDPGRVDTPFRTPQPPDS